MSGKVVRLSLMKSSSSETVETLRFLLRKAERGELHGSLVCVRQTSGEETVYFTDCYRADPSKAAGASVRIGMQLMHRG